MNERAIPKADNTLIRHVPESDLFYFSQIWVNRQGSLDGVVVRQDRTPAFTTDGLLDYIVELIVCEDKVKFQCQC